MVYTCIAHGELGEGRQASTAMQPEDQLMDKGQRRHRSSDGPGSGVSNAALAGCLQASRVSHRFLDLGQQQCPMAVNGIALNKLAVQLSPSITIYLQGVGLQEFKLVRPWLMAPQHVFASINWYYIPSYACFELSASSSETLHAINMSEPAS